MENEFRVLTLPEISPNINLLDLYGEDSTNNGTKSDCTIRLIKLPPLVPVEVVFSLVQSLNIKQRTYLMYPYVTNPSSLKVRLCAPTGKAAFRTRGPTPNQSNRELRPLSNEIVNSLYSRLNDLKLIIVVCLALLIQD